MWFCRKCLTHVEDGFEVCWQCGTALDGTEDESFRPERDGVIDSDTFQAEQAERARGRFVVMGTFATSVEAHLFRARLEAAGLHPQVLDELSATALGGLFSAGGVKVAVHEMELERALAEARRALDQDQGKQGPGSDQVRPARDSM